MYRNLLASLITFLLAFTANAQTITSTLRGQILDATTKQALTGATVIISNFDTLGTTTDTIGQFQFTKLAIGRYQVEISYLGYQKMILTEVLVVSGKENVLELELQADASNLSEVVVKAATANANTIGSYEFTLEEIFRFPATYNDPARLAMSYPGVAGTNDQANGITVRGLPPNLLQWRIEGIETVNPNHLSNAGTFSDQATQTAGGVNILSAQMLDNSRFYPGAVPITYANALGSVMDMRLRKGNNQIHEFTAQAGLLGMNLAMEGPFRPEGKASFLFNYRYSFTGLLTSFGIDFDGESIGFEDAAFTMNFPSKKGHTKVFGFGGRSFNTKAALPGAERQVDKDLRSINFDSQMGMLGFSQQHNISKRLSVKTAMGYSGVSNTRDDYLVPEGSTTVFGEEQSKLSLLHHWNWKMQNSVIHIGASFNRTVTDKTFFTQAGMTSATILRDGRISQLNPFVSWSLKSIDNINFQLGLTASFIQAHSGLQTPDFQSIDFYLGTDTKDFRILPNTSLSYKFSSKDRLTFSYAQYANIFPNALFVHEPYSQNQDILDIKTSKTHDISFSYEFFKANGTKFLWQLYYKQIEQLPGLKQLFLFPDNNKFLNYINEEIAFFSDINTFQGGYRTYGIEFLFQKPMKLDWYLQIGTSYYIAQFNLKGLQDFTDSRYNGNFTNNFIIGKEWVKHKAAKSRILGLNLGLVFNGGLWEREITLRNGFNTIIPRYESNFYTQQLPHYFRTDLRLYLKWNKPNRTTTLSLDIQNATNHSNVAYRYFDNFAQEILEKEQLGLIPLLNYRIEF